MAATFETVVLPLHSLFQRITFGLIIAAAFVCTIATFMAAFDQLPWLHFSVTYGETNVENAGMIAQISVTTLMLMLCFYLPTNRRVLALENSHRRFNIGMQDIAQAYVMAHAADRAGLFSLASEFDAVRERLNYLRDHPDLGDLEPGILEVAAQMSQVSKDLAETYSETRVKRAKAFLEQRQQEVRQFNDRLEAAKETTKALQHWLHEIELEETVSTTQFDRIRDELFAILDKLEGVEPAPVVANVVDLPKKVAE